MKKRQSKHQSMMPGGKGGGSGSEFTRNSRKGLFGAPKNDGNLFTSGSKVRERDIHGNHKGARKASSLQGCYITSACVEARGLSDDCYELKLLRMYRGEYVERLEGGEALLAEYRRKAPVVVRRINALGESRAQAVWEEIYERGVAPAVRLIQTGQWERAFELYKAMCRELERRFLATGGEEPPAPAATDDSPDEKGA